jgi:hypothetical protein
MAITKNGGKSVPRKPKKSVAKRATSPVKSSAPVEPAIQPKTQGPTALQEVGSAIPATAGTMKTAASTLSGVLVVGFCVSASMTANAWPCIHAILDGDTDSTLISMANFQIVGVLLMALAPLALVKAKDRFTFVSALVLGLVLLVINAGNAIETASHVREAAANGPLAAQLKAKSLTERIKRDTEARAAMGEVTPTSDSEVKAAQAAVEAAKLAQEQECKKVADRCRARQMVTQAAVEQLSAVSALRALSVKAERLEKQIDDAQHELDGIGPVPTHADNIAYRYSKLTGISEEWLTDNWPTLCGIGVELLGLLGPLVAMAAFSKRAKNAVPVELQRKSEPKADGRAIASFLQGPEAVEALPEAAHFAPERPVLAASTMSARLQVERYCNEKLERHSDASIPAKERYEGYVIFCGEQGWTPVSKSWFGKLVKSMWHSENSGNSSRPPASGSRARNGASSSDGKDLSQILTWSEDGRKNLIQRPHGELLELSSER